MPDIISVVFGTFFVIVIGGMVYTILKGLLEWSKNNKLPIVSIRATVLSKNSETTHRIRHRNTRQRGNFNSSSRTIRTITFQSSIDNTRHVFRVNRRVFDLIVEGDVGTLVHQGTRYHRFNVGQ